jgi:type I restriction enzyme S subunit
LKDDFHSKLIPDTKLLTDPKKLVSSSQVGQVQKHLNVGILNNAQIICPPLPLQQEFSHRVNAVEKLKASHRASLLELDALFASLQHRAFRGEL